MNLINTFVSDLLSDSNLLVPAELNFRSELAIKTLIEMIESLPKGDFSDFIHSNVKYDVTTLASLSEGVVVPNSTPVSLSDFEMGSSNYTQSGVYVLQHQADQYIGSSVNVFGRIGKHISTLQGLQEARLSNLKMLESANGLWQNITWAPVYVTTNYTNLALATMPGYTFSVGELDILRTLSRFVPLVLEQSLISALEPAFNNLSELVQFDTKAWDATLLSKAVYQPRGFPITIMDGLQNVIQEFPTIGSAANILGLSPRQVTLWVEGGKSVYVAILGMKVFFAILIASHRHGNKIMPLNPIKCAPLCLPHGPLSNLSPGAFWLFSPNKTEFFGPFLSFSEVLRHIHPSKSFTAAERAKLTTPLVLALNRESLVNTPKGKFYITCNPSKPPLAKSAITTRPVYPFIGEQ